MNQQVGLLLCALVMGVDCAQAQPTAKFNKVGFLNQSGHPPAAYEIFRQSLRELGYLEGKNIAIEQRATGFADLTDKATELVKLEPDVIVTTGGPSTRAVQKATKTIPIVFTSSGDPIEGGFIDSLARPGKNLTGVTFLAYELVGKRVELLKEADPKVSRVAVIANPTHPGEQRELTQTQSAARALGVAIDHHRVQSKSAYAAAFEAIRRDKANAILVFPETTTLENIQPITEFATKYALPSMFGWREYVGGGGLMAYGPNRAESYRRIWFAASAAVIGLLMVGLDIPWQYQLIGFGLLGMAALLLYRAYRKKNPGTFEQPNLNQRGLQYVGSELVLVEPIEQGSGKAKLGDGVWKVSGPELPAGARVRVTGVNGTILTVIPV